jgi:hypothetical protein
MVISFFSVNKGRVGGVQTLVYQRQQRVGCQLGPMSNDNHITTTIPTFKLMQGTIIILQSNISKVLALLLYPKDIFNI